MMEQTTTKISVVSKILDANERVAAENRHRFAHANVLAINLISSPGSGKTTLLETTIPKLMAKGLKVGVIAADIATTADAERIAAHGIRVIQITTDAFGGACHLEAPTVRQALDQFELHGLDILFIENVGNLVCPAEFDIGEALRVVMLSITEGEDKPLKYPLAFRVADCALISKIDLAPHLRFSMEKLRNCITQVNPKLPQFEISSHSEAGYEPWLNWLVQMHECKSELLNHTHDEEGLGKGHTHSHGHSHGHSH
ncbi:MAG: hydrogenase nickel incorporation protein HypB [bacterium]|nr:hydrogenase nickel incorporation protein HypB [bacterium]